MSLTTSQQLYLARGLAKRHGLFVVTKSRSDASGARTDYFLYRDHQHARPTLVGRRESAAALLALVEINTGCKAAWPTPSQRPAPLTHGAHPC